MMVLTPNGEVPIDSLREGDVIFSGEMKPIKVLWSGMSKDGWKISVEPPHTYILDGKVTHNVPAAVQAAFCFYADNASPASSTQLSGIDLNLLYGTGIPLGIRFRTTTSTGGWTYSATFQYSKDGGAWTNVGTSTIPDTYVNMALSPNFIDGATTTQRLGAIPVSPFVAQPAWLFVAGKCLESSITVSYSFGTGSNIVTENHMNVMFTPSAAGHYFEFRMSVGAGGTYTWVPRVTVVAPVVCRYQGAGGRHSFQ
jgi:hypothetical protein